MFNHNILSQLDSFDFSKIHPHHKYGLLGKNDKILLHLVAENLSPGSTIVEVGTYVGGSTSIIAHANSSIEIHSFDRYDPGLYDVGFNMSQAEVFQEFLSSSTRSLEKVSEKMQKNFNNVFLYEKISPDECNFWDKQIDMYFEDGSHRNPTLINNVMFWKTFLKVNGLILFHDYRPFLEDHHKLKCPDVLETVDLLIKSGDFKFVAHVGSTAILEKLR